MFSVRVQTTGPFLTALVWLEHPQNKHTTSTWSHEKGQVYLSGYVSLSSGRVYPGTPKRYNAAAADPHTGDLNTQALKGPKMVGNDSKRLATQSRFVSETSG